jgi:voltage-gated potassium channel
MEASRSNTPYALFMLMVSILSIAGVAVLTFGQLDPEQIRVLQIADFVVCLVFLLDFVVTLFRSSRPFHYLRTWGWLDLLSCVPMVDALRLSRFARIFRILRLIRGVKSARVLSQFVLDRRSESAFLAVALISLLLVFLSSIAILQFEDSPGSRFHDAGDAIWWAVTTITTVGYGDLVPRTMEGRIVASILMIGGVGLFGTLSGFIASWLLTPPKANSGPDVAQLAAEVRELRLALERSNIRDLKH